MVLTLAELEDSCFQLVLTLGDDATSRRELLDAGMVLLAAGYSLGPFVAPFSAADSILDMARAATLLRHTGASLRWVQAQGPKAPLTEVRAEVSAAWGETLDAVRLVAKMRGQDQDSAASLRERLQILMPITPHDPATLATCRLEESS